jgi:glutamate-1-semialdehyde aminotransferase
LSPKTESTLSQSEQDLQQQQVQAVGAYMGQLFSMPWMQQMAGALYQRQQKSMALMTELRQSNISAVGFWPFVGLFMPVCVERAEGSRLWDVDGNEYLDFFLGWGTQSLHGHNPEPVVRFVRELVGKNVGNAYTTPLHLEYVRLLKELVPHREKWAFLNSGSDATSAAIRIARAHTRRRVVVRFEGNSNGQHDLNSYNGISAFFGHPLVPFPPKKGPEVPLRSYSQGVQRLGQEDLLVLTFGDPASLDIIQKRKDEIACVITEHFPSQFPDEQKAIGFVRELSDVCQKSGVVFILDEVHSGFRYGPSGVAGYYDIPADLITYGKVMAAMGVPLSAVAGRSDIMEVAATTGGLGDVGTKTLLGTTHMGSHLAMGASYASMALLKEKGSAFYERTRKKAARLRSKLEALPVMDGVKLKLFGYGDFCGYMCFMRDQPMETHREFVNAMLLLPTNILALLLRSKGIYTHSVPLIYLGDSQSEQDIDTLVEKTREALEEMKANQFPFVPPASLQG